VFLVPQHNRLVTVNATRDALAVRPFDIIEVLNKAGIDYLFVESLPLTTAAPGKPYRYPIVVKSKQGGVKFALDSGPEGMTVSAKGELVWDVPADQEPGQTGVIVTIEDKSGQSIFHTFNIEVEATGKSREGDDEEDAPKKSLERAGHDPAGAGRVVGAVVTSRMR
jgi:hypothetical protein